MTGRSDMAHNVKSMDHWNEAVGIEDWYIGMVQTLDDGRLHGSLDSRSRQLQIDIWGTSRAVLRFNARQEAGRMVGVVDERDRP